MFKIQKRSIFNFILYFIDHVFFSNILSDKKIYPLNHKIFVSFSTLFHSILFINSCWSHLYIVSPSFTPSFKSQFYIFSISFSSHTLRYSRSKKRKQKEIESVILSLSLWVASVYPWMFIIRVFFSLSIFFFLFCPD